MNEVRRRIAARVYLLTILLVIIVVLIFSFISTNKHFVGAQPIKFALIIQVIIPIILGLPSIYIIKKYKLYQDSILGFKMFKIRDFLLGIIAMALIYPISIASNTILIKLIGSKIDNVSSGIRVFTLLPTNLIFVVFIAISILPGIFEELQFRGLYCACYRQAGYFKAALLTSLMFSLIHMNLIQVFYAFILGMLFYYIRMATGSTILTMLLHILFNAYSLAQIFLLKDKIYDISYIVDSKSLTWGVVFAILVIGLICLYFSTRIAKLIARLNNNVDLLENYFKPGKQKVFRVELFIAILICTIIIIAQLWGVLS